MPPPSREPIGLHFYSLSLLPLPALSHIHRHVEEVPLLYVKNHITMAMADEQCSGIACFAAGRRVGATSLRTATRLGVFNPTKPAVPAVGVRGFASEADKTGKIHQVIGAIVDVVCRKFTTPTGRISDFQKT